MKPLSLEEIESTLEFLNGNRPQTMKVNVDALARTAREYHSLREAVAEFLGDTRMKISVEKFYEKATWIVPELCIVKLEEALRESAE